MCQTEFGGWGWHYHFLWRNMEHGFGDWQELSHILIWLVISTPLKNISSSVGMILPNIWKNKTCSKPPTSHLYPIRIFHPGSVPTIFPWYSRYVPINQRNVSTPVAITWFCINRSSRPQGSPCLIVAIAQAIQALFHAAGQVRYAIPGTFAHHSVANLGLKVLRWTRGLVQWLGTGGNDWLRNGLSSSY